MGPLLGHEDRRERQPAARPNLRAAGSYTRRFLWQFDDEDDEDEDRRFRFPAGERAESSKTGRSGDLTSLSAAFLF